MTPYYDHAGITLHLGDCLEVMAGMETDSVDTIITDPPYGLNFMGSNWDHGVPGVRFWEVALQVAKPGAFLLAFGGTRTYHRLAVAIEDAGWEIRDCMMWLYGSGFPKSHSISKAIDRAKGYGRGTTPDRRNGANTNPHTKSDKYGGGYDKQSPFNLDTGPATGLAAQWEGYGTALKPAWEPIIVAMKPIPTTFADNAERHGVAGLWIDGSRIPTEDKLGGGMENGTSKVSEGWDRPWRTDPETIERNKRVTAAKIAKAESLGRWPANLILDEAASAAVDEMSGELKSNSGNLTHSNRTRPNGIYGKYAAGPSSGISDSGGASRFFYCAKSSRAERNSGLPDGMENTHITVKPLALMRYLCRLTRTPTGGVVLDPFMGSGSTGLAAIMEGRDFIGIELDESYLAIAEARIAAALAEPQQLEMAV